jgi:hypothetical protein
MIFFILPDVYELPRRHIAWQFMQAGKYELGAGLSGGVALLP